MKKILLFLILILLICSGNLALALNKKPGDLISTNQTWKGRIKSLSANDNWLAFSGNTTWSTFRNSILNLLKIQNYKKTTTYRVNVLDTTKLETNDGKTILLEELQIDDYVAVTGTLINQATNKIDDWNTETVYLIEANYIKVNNRRGLIEAFVKSVSNYFQKDGLTSLINKSSIVTNTDGSITLKPYDNTAERQGKCVGYGKPIVENREGAPTQPQVCCEGFKAYEALSVKFEEKPTVNIQGYVYTVKAYCYGLDGISSDIVGKVFEKDDCISEGEPLLIGGILAPEVMQNCCKGLIECISSDYKALPQPTGTEVISLNGFSYIVKGYCRKECPKSSSKWSLLPFLPSLPSIEECQNDWDCCTAKNTLCNKDCINNKCVDRSIGDVGFLEGCNVDGDCFYDGEKCLLMADGYRSLNAAWDWFLRNDPKGCVCNKNTHKCVLVEDKNTPTTDGCNQNITCDEETVFVCGKDGKTYNNPCEAIRCNTVVDCSGKCPCSTTPSVPSKPIIPSPNPGKCNVEDDCELCEAECFEKTMLDQLKSTGKTCGPAKAELKCVCENNLCLAMPDISNPDQPCDDILELVCGADGKTYQNKCEALKADTSVKCSGACPCDTQTPVAPCPAIYQPVCGTNNKTYSNSCSALQAKVDVKCDQACPCSSTPVVPPANGSGSGSTPVLPAQLKQINVHGFCGFQTETICSVDSDCEVAGCSGEICKAKTDGKLSSICNYIDCYTKPSNVYCGCDAGKCKWYGTLQTQSSNPVYSPVIDAPSTITIDPSGGIVAPSIVY